jgi:hypothetical protein
MCGQSDERDGYAPRGVMIYAGCGLRKAVSERQAELW